MLISWALRKSLSGYNIGTFKSDVMAGLIVSLVALPLAMALAIAVGLSPQYGIYTAIVAGVSVPLLGGSFHQVSGPTAAFVVIIAPIVSTHGLRGLIITTVMAGGILVAVGILKLGRYINYIPYPVTTGFTSGIAVVIGVLSLNDFLGLHIAKLPESFIEKIISIAENLPFARWPETLIGLISIIVMFTSGRFIKQIPSPIVGIGLGTVLGIILNSYGVDIATIGSRFSYSLSDGSLVQGIPPYIPSFEIPGISTLELFRLPFFSELKDLSIPAVVVAALAALESLLSAAVADGMAGTKHNPNAELIGIGIGNILSGLASGMPATGAIARTATNIQNGGRTPLASSIHAVFILGYILFFAHYMSYVPMASLAALLLLVAYRMSHIQQFMRILKISPLEDSIVLIVCFIFTVVIDMVAGVAAGVVMACFLLVRRISNITQLHISDHTRQSSKMNNNQVPKDTIVYHINGSLFFGNVEQVLEQIEIVSSQTHTFIIDLENVPLLDMTGMIAIKRIVLDLSKNKKNTILCVGKPFLNAIQQKLREVSDSGLYIKESLDEALELANTLLDKG
ncbi:MAG: SulP family inorganic anion transporter [Alphaproteobacteria bacterium]|nr:SulP family inorganic anion transporter [Alphaproteobacteria bacterium]